MALIVERRRAMQEAVIKKKKHVEGDFITWKSGFPVFPSETSICRWNAAIRTN
jgi:hypothetical protein